MKIRSAAFKSGEIDIVTCMSPSSWVSRKTGGLKKGKGKQKQLGAKKS